MLRNEYISLYTLRHQLCHHLRDVLQGISHSLTGLEGRGWDRLGPWGGFCRLALGAQAQRVSGWGPGCVCPLLHTLHGQPPALIDADVPAATWAPVLLRLTHLQGEGGELQGDGGELQVLLSKMVTSELSSSDQLSYASSFYLFIFETGSASGRAPE